MKLFIWEKDVDFVSSEYHNIGGAVVIAADDQGARQILREHRDDMAEKSYGDRYPEKELPRHDSEYDLAVETEEKVIAFPDAGCC